jgi:hypothetical protein
VILASTLLLLQTGFWTSIPPLPTPRQEVGVAAIEGQVYVIGGFDSRGRGSAVVEIFDTRSNTWRPGPPIPVAVHHPMVAAIGNKVFVAGGYAEPSFAVANTFELDTDTMTWTRKADMPTARGAGAAVAHNGSLYVIGGDRAGITVQDTAVFDPATDVWTQLAPMPTPRNHHAAAAIRGKIYVVGGRPGNLANNEAFDPIGNTWTAKTPMPTPRSGIAAAALRNQIHVFGGEGNRAVPTGIFSEHESYDPALDSWTRFEPMPTPRHGIGAAVVGNRIFIPGGSPIEGFGTTAEADFFSVNEELLLPQFVTGGPYSTSIVITNPDPLRTADATVSLTNLNGGPLETNLHEAASGDSVRSSITVLIPPLAARTVIGSEATSPRLKVGTARVRASTRVSAYAIIRGVGPQLTVYPSIAARQLVLDVRRTQAHGIHTGIAILNLATEPANLTLRFHDSATGQEVLQVTRILAAGEQLSRFIHELFAELQNIDFAGTLTLQSTAQLAVAGLSFEPSGVVTIPAIPIE